jgi:hypothetical protein
MTQKKPAALPIFCSKSGAMEIREFRFETEDQKIRRLWNVVVSSGYVSKAVYTAERRR